MRFRTTISALISIPAALVLSAVFVLNSEAAPGGVPGAPPGHGKGHGAVTKITFKLDDHNVALGEMLTGAVLVRTRAGKQWEPLAGATLSLQIAKTEVATLVTDADGAASVAYAPSEGDHVIRVVYAGDDLHKSARRAQGFNVAAGDPTPTPTPTPSESPTPSETPTA